MRRPVTLPAASEVPTPEVIADLFNHLASLANDVDAEQLSTSSTLFAATKLQKSKCNFVITQSFPSVAPSAAAILWRLRAPPTWSATLPFRVMLLGARANLLRGGANPQPPLFTTARLSLCRVVTATGAATAILPAPGYLDLLTDTYGGQTLVSQAIPSGDGTFNDQLVHLEVRLELVPAAGYLWNSPADPVRHSYEIRYDIDLSVMLFCTADAVPANVGDVP